MRRRLLATVALTTALLVPSFALGSAGAAPPSGGWADMTITPDDPAAQDHSGTISFGVAGMPDATYTVEKSVDDGADVEVLEDIEEYVPAGSPFGAVFGASGPSTESKFLKTRYDGELESAATVTVTFASPTPAGMLGFALSDVDVDSVVVNGTKADSSALTGAELVGEAFNLCDASDAPPNCDGESAPYDVPTWDPTTRAITGNDGDSEGAAAWFQPSVSVSTLTITMQSLPERGDVTSTRLWLAALGSTVAGTVSFVDGATSTPATVELVGPDGSVVATTTTGADGTYTLGPALPVTGYQVRIVVPDGLTLRGTNPVDVDLSTGSAVVDFTLAGSAAPNYTG